MAGIALTLVLLVGAGLLLRSFIQLVSVDPGFSRGNVITLNVARPFATDTVGEKRLLYYQEVLQALRQIPGVLCAGGTTTLPSGESEIGVNFEPLEQQEVSVERLSAAYRSVTPEYFRTLEIPLLQGRYLEEADRRGSRGAIVINPAFAEKVWPGRSPIGRSLRVGASFGQDGEPSAYEIVGVVGDVRLKAFDVPAGPEMFLPLAQHTWPFLSFVEKPREIQRPIWGPSKKWSRRSIRTSQCRASRVSRRLYKTVSAAAGWRWCCCRSSPAWLCCRRLSASME